MLVSDERIQRISIGQGIGQPGLQPPTVEHGELLAVPLDGFGRSSFGSQMLAMQPHRLRECGHEGLQDNRRELMWEPHGGRTAPNWRMER